MKMMLRAAILAGLSVLCSQPAAAASFVTPSGISGSATLQPGSPLAWEVLYDGFGGDPAGSINGLSAKIVFNFLGTSNDNKTYAFSYNLMNTSFASSEVRAFGFDIDPTTGLKVTLGQDDLFDLPTLNPNGTVPSQFGSVDFCLKIDGNKNNCASGRTGVESGDSASGTFFLNYETAKTQVTLDRFFVRYQAVDGLTGDDYGITSAIGRGTPGAVPEPSTWLMLLVGFGFIGGAVRRSKASGRVAPRGTRAAAGACA